MFDEWVYVLRCNWKTVAVFSYCRPSWLVTPAAAMYQGISALEISAACSLLGIPPRGQKAIFVGIQIMVKVATEVYAKEKR